MVQPCGLSPQALRVQEGEFPADETPLETAWTFWYDKKSSDRKESDKYMEGLKQLGSFNTIEGFYRHYTYLLRPNEFPRDHNTYFFRKGYKPMWEEFPEGGCWIIRIKRKVSQNYVNHMWENLLLACIGEAFEMPDVVGCVLSTRLKDDVLSVWNISNRDTQARFRIGEKLKEVLELDMNAMIQYKDHMQSLQDYSTFRNAKNYMFAPSPAATPAATPMQGNLATPVHTHTELAVDPDLDQGLLPPAAIDEMLPPAAIDSEGFGYSTAWKSPTLSASAPPWLPGQPPSSSSPLQKAVASPQLSADAAPWLPGQGLSSPQLPKAANSPQLSADAAPWLPPAMEVEEKAEEEETAQASPEPVRASYAAIVASAKKTGPPSPSKASVPASKSAP